MPTLDATVGGAVANSYALVTQADTYFDERLGSSMWSLATAEDKARALIMATRRVDAEVFEGSRASVVQALDWPRTGADYEDGSRVDSGVIPRGIQQAVYELALELIVNPSALPGTETGLEGFDSVKVGPIEVEIHHDKDGPAPALSDLVSRLLAPFLRLPAQPPLTIRLARA